MDADKVSAQSAARAEDLRLDYCTEGLRLYRLRSANSFHKKEFSKVFTHMLSYKSVEICDKRALFLCFATAKWKTGRKCRSSGCFQQPHSIRVVCVMVATQHITRTCSTLTVKMVALQVCCTPHLVTRPISQ